MESIYCTDISDDVVYSTLRRMTSQTYKLLPMREESKEWIKPLETLSLELLGLSALFPDNPALFSAVCKMEGIKKLGEDMEFYAFRRSIFEICGLLSEVSRKLEKEE